MLKDKLTKISRAGFWIVATLIFLLAMVFEMAEKLFELLAYITNLLYSKLIKS